MVDLGSGSQREVDDTFTDSLAKLTGEGQKAVKTTGKMKT